MTPAPVRWLIALLVLTAVTTAAVEWLNWWLAPDGGYALFVRTGWALLRSFGFLVLIWQVRRSRATAPALALILSITTLFALARLVVPRQGMPTALGIAGFALVAALCAAVLLLFYRSDKVSEHLQRQPNRLVVTKRGIDWQPAPPRRKPVPGWLLTTRVAAFSYSPLMLVGCVVAIGLIFEGDVTAAPLIGAWFVAGLVTSYAVLVVSIFLVRGQGWARSALGWLTVIVLAIDLPLCWLLLGVDGLVRDGGPLLVSALLVLYGLSRTSPIAGNTYQTKT